MEHKDVRFNCEILKGRCFRRSVLQVIAADLLNLVLVKYLRVLLEPQGVSERILAKVEIVGLVGNNSLVEHFLVELGSGG